MKTLQNDYTTPEQSKRLLELGVPADSADCFYSLWRGDVCTDEPFGPFIRGTVSAIDYQNDIPCWSVGRLIEICLKCSTLEQRQVRFFCNGDDDEYSLIDYVVTVLEGGVMTNHMDFSKLEE